MMFAAPYIEAERVQHAAAMREWEAEMANHAAQATRAQMQRSAKGRILLSLTEGN